MLKGFCLRITAKVSKTRCGSSRTVRQGFWEHPESPGIVAPRSARLKKTLLGFPTLSIQQICADSSVLSRKMISILVAAPPIYLPNGDLYRNFDPTNEDAHHCARKCDQVPHGRSASHTQHRSHEIRILVGGLFFRHGRHGCNRAQLLWHMSGADRVIPCSAPMQFFITVLPAY